MPAWIYLWIFRIARGEKIEKAKPYDYRYWFGVLALTPVWIATFAFTPFGKRILDQGTTAAIWIYLVMAGLILWAFLRLWARFVPAIVSLSAGICIWAVALWTAWHFI